MPTLDKISIEVIRLTHNYKRKGGKKNRRQQVQRMLFFALWVNSNFHNVGTVHRMGKRHVLAFMQAHDHLSEATLERGYRYAIRDLFALINRPDPFK